MGSNKFGSVGRGMLTLFMDTTGGTDWGMTYALIEPLGPLYTGAYVFFILFFIISVCNIVTSLFVEKALRMAKPDTEILMAERQKEYMNDFEDLMNLCTKFGIDKDADTFDTSDYNACMADDSFRLFLDVRGIHIMDPTMFYTMLAATNQKTGTVDVRSFVRGCMKLKGNASSIDVHTLIFETKILHEKLEKFILSTGHQLTKLRAASTRMMMSSTSHLALSSLDASAPVYDVGRMQL